MILLLQVLEQSALRKEKKIIDNMTNLLEEKPIIGFRMLALFLWFTIGPEASSLPKQRFALIHLCKRCVSKIWAFFKRENH